ncbi:hypothetical protein B7494_g7254 [Chlorociboria aeruginascens]|nr:hypothetical protein B7494_g7254 [Chlorociboria aeruginascens]
MPSITTIKYTCGHREEKITTGGIIRRCMPAWPRTHSKVSNRQCPQCERLEAEALEAQIAAAIEAESCMSTLARQDKQEQEQLRTQQTNEDSTLHSTAQASAKPPQRHSLYRRTYQFSDEERDAMEALWMLEREAEAEIQEDDLYSATATRRTCPAANRLSRPDGPRPELESLNSYDGFRFGFEDAAFTVNIPNLGPRLLRPSVYGASALDGSTRTPDRPSSISSFDSEAVSDVEEYETAETQVFRRGTLLQVVIPRHVILNPSDISPPPLPAPIDPAPSSPESLNSDSSSGSEPVPEDEDEGWEVAELQSIWYRMPICESDVIPADIPLPDSPSSSANIPLCRPPLPPFRLKAPTAADLAYITQFLSLPATATLADIRDAMSPKLIEGMQSPWLPAAPDHLYISVSNSMWNDIAVFIGKMRRLGWGGWSRYKGTFEAKKEEWEKTAQEEEEEDDGVHVWFDWQVTEAQRAVKYFPERSSWLRFVRSPKL